MVTEIRSFKKHATFYKVSGWGRRGGGGGGSLFVVLYGRSRFSKVGVALGLLFSASLWPCIGRAQSKHPNLILLFEPASCTAELQPLDLSYNFVFKTGVATLFASWLSQVAQEQLLRGISQDQLTFDLSLKSVQTPFVKWVYMTP